MILAALLLFQLSFSIPAPVSASATARLAPPVLAADSLRQMERRAFDFVNAERKRNGLPALIWSDDLAKVAREHSDEMAKFLYVDHMDREGREVAERARDGGIRNWRALGENIAYNLGYKTPVDEAVIGWMNSPHHRDNILSTLWSEAGMGIAVSSRGGYYFTQVFKNGN